MKKVIPFTKTISFDSMIAEITDISISDDLKLNDLSEVVGNIIITGKYKKNIASSIIDDFNYNLPCVISIDSKYDTSDLEISINDFNFEIINEQDLKVNVDVVLNNLIDRSELLNKEIEIPVEIEELDSNIDNNIINLEIDNNDTVKDLEKETINNVTNTKSYSTYYVYIMQENDTLNSIMEKYKTNKEELEKYNDLDSLINGSKIIIPCINE